LPIWKLAAREVAMGPTIETLNELADFWSIAIQKATWQGGLAIAVAWALVRCRRGLPPRVACWAWRLADLKLIVAFLWATPLLVPLLPSSQETQRPHVTIAAPEISASVAGGSEGIRDLAREAASVRAHKRLSPACFVLVLWLIGALSAATLAGREAIAVTRVRRSCLPVNCPDLRDAVVDLACLLGLRNAPEVRAGPAVSRPMLVGAFRPAILLPIEMLCDPRSTAAIRPVLAHELAHVGRRDLLWSSLAAIVRAMFFFHPLVWLAHREALLAREAACDALALRASGVCPSEYGRILVDIAARGTERAAYWGAPLGMAGSAGSLKRRLIAMKKTQQPSRRRLLSWAFALLVIGVAGVIPWQLVPRAANGQGPPAVGTGRAKQPARAEKPIRVLCLGGPASTWEMRYLARTVVTAKEFQLDRQVLRAAGQVEDREFGAGRYDVYVLANLPAVLLTREQQRKLVEAVTAGAGVIFLGGRESYAGGGWGRSEFTGLLPTAVDNDPDWIEPVGGVRVIPEATKFFVSFLELGANEEESARIARGLTPLLGANRLGVLNPSALLLAKTDGGGPFLVGQVVGKGRVLAIAGEIWPWARQPGEPGQAYRRFWERAIEWVGHRARMGGNADDR
jgi:beta-lactamase regulating signal transducer with metallopeptidase domain